MKRSEANPAFCWKLEDIFPTNEAWEKEFSDTLIEIGRISDYQGNLAQSSDTLFEALSLDSKISLHLERLFVYARMRRDEDAGNTYYQGLTDRAAQLETSASAASSWMVPELIAIPSEQLQAMTQEDRFAPFRFGLSDIDRQRAHVLSAKEERLLSMVSDPLSSPSTIFTMLSDVELSFGTVTNADGDAVPLTHGSYGTFLQSPVRSVRKEAYEKLYAAYGSVKNTIAATYAASVKGDIFRAKARGFDGVLEASLFSGNVPSEVYTHLIEAVHEKIPALRKYIQLRQRQLKLDQLEMYDLYTPIVPDCAMPMTFDEAKATVKEALKPLGETYQSLLEEAYTSGWIDVYENEGKKSGAYQWGAYGSHPFVLLNHQDDVNHAFTLAHELGHAMHSYFSDHAQPFETAAYRIMVAEVASTVNEMLMTRYLLSKETDRTKRAFLINQFLEQVRTTCFRQTMFAEFEYKAHRMAENGEPLTVESLSKVYRELNETYYPDVHVDDNIALEWLRIPHFYTAFYVYQYATGICTAIALSNQILTTGSADRYLAFLKTGGSDYPVRLLQNAGVDLTDKNSILSALDVFENSVDELISILEEQ